MPPLFLTDEQHQALAVLPQRQLCLQKKRRRSFHVLSRGHTPLPGLPQQARLSWPSMN